MTKAMTMTMTKAMDNHDWPPSGPTGSVPPMTLEEAMSTGNSSTELRTAFRLNGGFSALSGLLGTIAAGPIADLFEVEQVWLIRSLGVALIGFAVGLFILASRPDSEVRFMSGVISAADVSWVLGTVAVIGLGWLSTAGAIIMSVVAVVVLAFAVAQLLTRPALQPTG